MYEKVDAGMNFVDREKAVSEFWKDNDILKKSREARVGQQTYTVYDGPPTANGKPHIGHILTRVFKDIIPRYKTMKGYHVRLQAGWDTHGLPVELEVEKLLGMDGKQDIEKYGIEPFTQKCKESVWKYKTEWEKMSDRVGYWADMEHPYVTYDDNYIESVWWSLKQIADKGLIYKGHKIVPYCPRCGTALSSHEVAQGYKDVKDKTVVAKFKALGMENTYLLAWTTTPWTLPSNVALCVNAHEQYVTVESDGTRYILAKALVENHFKEGATVLEEYPGSKLEGVKYQPLFDFVEQEYRDKAWFVVSDDYVTLTDGTGIVHIAPAFGEDDARVGRVNKLPFVQLVDDRGKMKSETGTLAGLPVKDANKPVIALLKEKELLFSVLEVTHSYPHCWRCDTPLLYYARSTWFISMTKVRDELVRNNKTVQWIPAAIGEGRFGNFLENVIDWGLSRERYWGTPLPIWECECGHTHVIGSKAELKQLSGMDGEIELHKPYVDQVTFKCPVCGKTMHRVPEVIDCWYDSGSMPFAQLHYPFENKELFEERFPADFISEAVDQTRGWFYTLMAISTLLFDKAPYRNCLVLGHVCDKNGEKMSKHKGNVVDPWSVLDAQGADAVRWYFYTASNPWLPSRFYADAVSESQRKFLGTLWNIYSFFVLYADIDGFNPTAYRLSDAKLTLMDRWVLSELNVVVETVGQNLDRYDITDAARTIQDFVDVLSNWYVRRGRERYWGKEMTEDKIAAYVTLHTVLVTLSKLCAPFVPFISETMYRNLVVTFDPSAPISVHLCTYPTTDQSAIDLQLNAEMKTVVHVAVAARSVRAAANLKNRQPLRKMYVAMHGQAPSEELLGVAADEVNVLSAEVISDADGFVSYELKPQLRTLGPKYGEQLGLIRTLLAEKPSEIMAEIKAGRTYNTQLNGTEVVLGEDDLLVSVKSKEGYASESYGGVTVILDTQLDDQLRALGNARELISKIQTMRKENDFVVTDRIVLGIDEASLRQLGIDAEGKQLIVSSVMATALDTQRKAIAKEWDINGLSVVISLEKSER